MKQQMLDYFEKAFGDAAGAEVFFAPGRVNLIGEHTDYNGGTRFPMRPYHRDYGAVRKRKDRKLRFYSANFDHLGVIESDLDSLTPMKKAGWTNYPKGVMWAFDGRGMKMEQGLDLAIFGIFPTVPAFLPLLRLKCLQGRSYGSCTDFRYPIRIWLSSASIQNGILME